MMLEIFVSNRPKPTALRVLEGNRGNVEIKHNLMLPPALPKSPKTLDRIGKKKWKQLAQEFYALGVLTEIDVDALEVYCNLYSDFVQASNELRGKEFDNLDPTEKAIKSKEIRIKKMQIAKEMRLYMVEFGMTPASRTKLDIKKTDPKRTSKLTRILDG